MLPDCFAVSQLTGRTGADDLMNSNTQYQRVLYGGHRLGLEVMSCGVCKRVEAWGVTLQQPTLDSLGQAGHATGDSLYNSNSTDAASPGPGAAQDLP